ncbi:MULTISPECIES: hypothetical protein [Amycolatopsis]|uniref:Uncharacterized protein n=1 Tax=Amycolatopsis echigonensis TaxID=2576905 RepID=A0A8E1VU90_9PSEU|nr:MULTISPECIES: hypothetical protein [Amycolatopsis]MBB2498370.1 hypothetical protein [Amycolatopsis echigonensis]
MRHPRVLRDGPDFRAVERAVPGKPGGIAVPRDEFARPTGRSATGGRRRVHHEVATVTHSSCPGSVPAEL